MQSLKGPKDLWYLKFITDRNMEFFGMRWHFANTVLVVNHTPYFQALLLFMFKYSPTMDYCMYTVYIDTKAFNQIKKTKYL